MDPSHKHVDWAQRYRDEHTPWDRGRAHRELQQRIASGQLAAPEPEASAFVPGCGRGHDALALARAGWKVTGIDMVGELEQELSTSLGALGGQFLVGDALQQDCGSFDFIWEHTFLCALRPDQRQAWSKMINNSLRPGGRLGVLIFPANKQPADGGPPWGYNVEILGDWLGKDLELLETAAVDPASEPRDWDQAFALFRKL